MTQRVVSLVPSLTETLIAAGVNVVGRTRFCIHPADKVQGIKVVGGTKQANWQTVAALEPDLVLFDREENTKEMADTCPFPQHTTHITSVNNVGDELAKLADTLESAPLHKQAADWQQLAQAPALPAPRFDRLPGLIEMLGAIPKETLTATAPTQPTPQRIEYLIWQNPWMAIGPQTFIGSVLAKTGFANLLPDHPKPYPTLQQCDLTRPDTFYLFSSEPYPFARHLDELRSLGIQGAVVDGEFFSWFGIRSHRLLQSYLQQAGEPP